MNEETIRTLLLESGMPEEIVDDELISAVLVAFKSVGDIVRAKLGRQSMLDEFGVNRPGKRLYSEAPTTNAKVGEPIGGRYN
jgi:hypothetical protein